MVAHAEPRSGPRRRERLGVLGGTFDPVHVAHIAAAQEARAALDLDRVLLVVAGDPWQKAGCVHAPARLRLEMVEAAVAGLPGLEAGSLEIDREGPTYTIDTLTALTAADREVFLIVGGDVAAHLDTWVRIDEIRARATLVVVERAGESTSIRGRHAKPVERVVMPRLDVSSTDVRRRVAEGMPIEFIVPPGAVRIIRGAGLYTRIDDAGERPPEE